MHGSNQCGEVYREQQSIATRVAMTNVGKLGIDVTEQEMVDLRDLYVGQMTKHRSLDIHNYSLLLQILSRYARCRTVNPSQLALVRRSMVIRLFQLNHRGLSYREIARLAWVVMAIDLKSFIVTCCSASLGWMGTCLKKRLGHQSGCHRDCP
jgi:predicted DNA-binding transcriptional regulator